jgi:hypothetical protein
MRAPVSDYQRHLGARVRLALQPAACCLLLAGALACGHEATQPACLDICPAPPTPVIYGSTTFITPYAGAPPSLMVYALVINDTPQGITVQTGPACPLAVAFGPGDAQVAPAECTSLGASVAVAPNDTTVLTRIFGPDSLALFAPGMYTVSIAAMTSDGYIGIGAGEVQLPDPKSP